MSQNVLTIDFTVTSNDMAPNGQLSLTALMKYFQEAAHQHANNLGVGFHQLKAQNIFWVLSSIHIEVDELPAFDEPFSVETWPRGSRRLFSIRDFLVHYNGQVVARATSSWLMVNLTSKRPVRPESLLAGIEFLPEKAAYEQEPAMDVISTSPELLESRVVRFSDLDINRHVNNTRYVEWIFDAVHLTHLKNFRVSSLTVQFSSEFKEGESADILLRDDNNRHSAQIDILHKGTETGVRANLLFSEGC